jgi:hypothetical protein
MPCLLADESGAGAPLKSKAWVDVGLFYPFFDTTARLDISVTERGTTIDLEKDLGMDSEMRSSSFRAGMYLSKRWRLEAEYFNLDRSSTGEISREIHWGDEIYEAGATIEAFFDVRIGRLALGYDFFVRDKAIIGFTLGAHLLDSGAGIASTSNIGGGDDDFEQTRDVSTHGILPVPNVGFHGSYILGRKWRLDGRLDWFGISLGEWDGVLFASDVQFVYFISDSWTASLGVQYFNITVNYDPRFWRGGLEYQYLGPRIEVGFEF